ncbi:MAG: chloride channel protein [Acidobacteriota bacterium]|nr:chloride channel protein [Acidobacteriota bacterium]
MAAGDDEGGTGTPAGRRLHGRVRRPAPLIAWRLPSGRGATEQPNATDDPVPLTARFWAAVVAAGIATGLLGALMMFVLFSVEHLVYGHPSVGFEYAVAHTGALRRVVALAVAGAVGGIAWYALRRATPGERAEVDDAVWNGTGELSFRRSLGSGLISEVVVGMGASIGRENAPKVLGGAAASVLSGWMGLTAAQRRLLVACSAGAGLACVYNVPLGGALFTAEILVGTISLPVILPAICCSGIATAVAWVYLPRYPTYVGLPDFRFSMPVLVWAILAGPVLGLAAVLWVRLVGFVSHHRTTGAVSVPASVLTFTLVGLMGIAYPQLFGNGKDMAHDAFLGVGTMGTFAVLAVLKPVATGLTLGSGASGGLFTPTLGTGAALGGFLGLAWSTAWGGGPVAVYALVGAAALIGASMQAPLAAIVLVLELTHTGFGVLVPMLGATVGATATARYVDGYSIYSARLPAHVT